jgi:hypothetical protein
MWKLRHRQTKEAETDMLNLPPPRHVSTLPFFVGGSWEDYKQKPDHGYAGAVIDPSDHEALAGKGEKPGAMSHKAQSRDQSENSDGSQ